MSTEEPLPGMPAPTASPAGTSLPAGVRFLRYRPRTRQLCSDCIQDIHARGVAVAAYPRSVRWRALIGSATYLLCEQHKDERQGAL